MLNKREKINYSLILILLLSIFIIVVTGIYNRYPFGIALIVLFVNLLIVAFYELWQSVKTGFNNNERATVLLISKFLKHLGISDDKIIKSLNPYVKAYNREDLSDIIPKTNTDKYLKHYTYWETNTNRIYILSIIMEIIYSLFLMIL